VPHAPSRPFSPEDLRLLLRLVRLTRLTPSQILDLPPLDLTLLIGGLTVEAEDARAAAAEANRRGVPIFPVAIVHGGG
jgi:hypothetical protein